MTNLINLTNELIKQIPKELVDKLLEHYTTIKNNFRLGRHENTELNASKFSEVVFRIIQHKLNGTHTPLDRQVRNFTDQCRSFESSPAGGIDDTLRIHIPRTLILIVDIRNKRGVGHVSGIHNPNDMDSALVKINSDWIFAEICRVFANLSNDEAQNVIESIIKTELPVIEKVGDMNRVLDTSLSYDKQVMYLLLEEYPSFVADEDLLNWVEHSNKTVFKKILKDLHKDRFIEYKNGNCKLLQPGIKLVEGIINQR